MRRRRAAAAAGAFDPWARLDMWRADPFVWATERLGLRLRRWADYAPEAYARHRWDGTPEPLWSVGQALARWDSVAVSSATGIGKTFLGAVLTFWFLDCWPPIIDPTTGEETHQGAQVVTVAPKEDQLKLHLWKEIGRLWHLFQAIRPEATLDSLRIRMRPGRDDWGAVGFICGVGADEDVANRARGFHMEHGLFLFEETTGIDRAILDAFAFTCTAPHNLRCFYGNRDAVDDTLGQVSREPGVVDIRASALDHPNVVAEDPNLIPGAQSVQVLANWRQRWGVDNRLYLSRARGVAPTQSVDALIRREWLEAAAARGSDPQWQAWLKADGVRALGVDVANSQDGDKAAIAEGIGRLCLTVSSYACPDANAFARQHVHPLLESRLVWPDRVGIDTVGVGVGAYNELKRLGFEVQSLNGGAAEWDSMLTVERFKNLRGQMWFQARVDLQREMTDPKGIGLPHDPELWQDLMTVRWHTLNGRVIVESKEELVKRLGRSPDKGDAFVYWNWIRQASNQPTIAALPFQFG